MFVKICGIPHEVIERDDNFDIECHLGQIDFKQAVIILNKGMAPAVKEETLFHEILHGMLVHIGKQELSDDEQFVTSLSNAIYQTFQLRGEELWEKNT